LLKPGVLLFFRPFGQGDFMTTSYVRTTTLQANGGMPSAQIPFTSADNSFAQTQTFNQALAEQLGNFLLFSPNGLVDGARTNQAQNEVRSIIVYLTTAVISAAGANPAIWRTTMYDWAETLTARQAYRLAHYGF
jgi:hypothetical protein